jgi:hypothetical protein
MLELLLASFHVQISVKFTIKFIPVCCAKYDHSMIGTLHSNHIIVITIEIKHDFSAMCTVQ